MFNRIIVVVLDSVGIGALPDAGEYGDHNANTLANIARLQGGLFLPTLGKMGLGRIASIEGIRGIKQPTACFGKMAEISKAKDTTSGHWEMAGCPVFAPFPVYPEGFPMEVISKFERLIGRKVLANIPASGTAIIAEMGSEHMDTGYPIVYTSGDSVFQIAAHEDIIPLDELYHYCKIARNEVLIGKHAVGRVIARPFIGIPGNFVRTANRHDFSLEPPQITILDILKKNGYQVTGVGKIGDVFAQRGLTDSFPTKSNDHGMEITINLVQEAKQPGLIMVNLVDFDSMYGHRNDVAGYANALQRFDGQLPTLLNSLMQDDLLILTADHGCDPTTLGTDHTREYVPLLVYSLNSNHSDLGIRDTFADVAATIADNFQLPILKFGKSFLAEL